MTQVAVKGPVDEPNAIPVIDAAGFKRATVKMQPGSITGRCESCKTAQAVACFLMRTEDDQSPVSLCHACTTHYIWLRWPHSGLSEKDKPESASYEHKQPHLSWGDLLHRGLDAYQTL